MRWVSVPSPWLRALWLTNKRQLTWCRKKLGIHSSKSAWSLSGVCLHGPVELCRRHWQVGKHMAQNVHDADGPPQLGRDSETHNCLDREPRRMHVPHRSHLHCCPTPQPTPASCAFSDPSSHLYLSKMCLPVVSTHWWGNRPKLSILARGFLPIFLPLPHLTSYSDSFTDLFGFTTSLSIYPMRVEGQP